MSTTPPEQPSTPQEPPAGGYGRPGRPNVNFNLDAIMPTPGNAELVVYILAMILLAIIALASDAFDVGGWVTAFTAITVAYLVSRGIAKASRVLER
jgi:hypothetical protein